MTVVKIIEWYYELNIDINPKIFCETLHAENIF